MKFRNLAFVLILAVIILVILMVYLMFFSGSLLTAGVWRIENDQKINQVITFNPDGTFFLLGDRKDPQLTDDPRISVYYETDDKVQPNRVYLILKSEDKTTKVPLGIYKIENRKLIIKRSAPYDRGVEFIDKNATQSQFPENFSGDVDVYDFIRVDD